MRRKKGLFRRMRRRLFKRTLRGRRINRSRRGGITF